MRVSRSHRRSPGHRAGLFRFQGTYSIEVFEAKLLGFLAGPSARLCFAGSGHHAVVLCAVPACGRAAPLVAHGNGGRYLSLLQ